jgi:phosphonate transport system ATP-binding protein
MLQKPSMQDEARSSSACAANAAELNSAPGELAVAGLAKSFQKNSPVFEDVGFAIPRGQSVALIGANGAGKSTLLRSCLRLIEPDRGDIVLFGEDYAKAPRRRMLKARRQVGFIFQRHNLSPRLSALSNVIHGRLGHGGGPAYWLQALAPRWARHQAMHCLEQVKLPHVAMQRADELSGGQSQRVAIARALMQEPRLMIADEPVASLDPRAGEEVMELFVSLIRERRLTLLFTSHNLEHALKFADRVIGLHRGRVAVDEAAGALCAADLNFLYE